MVRSRRELNVQEVMSREVVFIHPDDTLHDALDLIVENRISALPVINGRGRCVGMLSTSDLIDLAHELEDQLHNLGRAGTGRRPGLMEQLTEAFGSERVSEHMTESVAGVTPKTPLREAAAVMLQNRVHRLPVVDRHQRLLGILSTTDIMAALCGEQREPLICSEE